MRCRSWNCILLGRFDVRQFGQTIVISGRKERALLAVLAMPPGKPRARDQLASMLWSNSGRDQAHDSLRQAIARLRNSFGIRGTLPLKADREVLVLVADAIAVDVQQFEEIGEQTSLSAEQATALYRGDFADGLDGLDPAFGEWLLVERERLREKARAALRELLEAHLAAGTHNGAAAAARKLTALDALDETAHRALMRIYFQQGQSSLALRQYQRCRDVLRKEIGEVPEFETERFHRASGNTALPLGEFRSKASRPLHLRCRAQSHGGHGKRCRLAGC